MVKLLVLTKLEKSNVCDSFNPVCLLLTEKSLDCRDKSMRESGVKQASQVAGTAVAFQNTDSLIVHLQLGVRLFIRAFLRCLCH